MTSQFFPDPIIRVDALTIGRIKLIDFQEEGAHRGHPGFQCLSFKDRLCTPLISLG